MTQTKVGWRSYVPTSYPTDADATAFMTATGITDSTITSAINTLVNELKLYGIWSKMKAIYPFVGGSATTHKFNLKDPRDLDSAYRLVFAGGWTHTPTGAKPNGTTSYADTKFNLSTNLPDAVNSNHISLYIRENINEVKVDMGIINTGTYLDIESRVSDVSYYGNLRANNAISFNNTDSRGLYINTRTTNTLHKVFINSTLKGSDLNSSSGTINGNISLAARYNTTNGLYEFRSSKEQAFASIGDGLTDGEAASFYLAVQKFQTTLGRQIGTPVLPEGQVASLLETYYGSSASYSLRKLRTAYSGSAIRVRRSSDNTEQNIGFTSSGDLDTTALLAFTGTSNGFVVRWYDQSGNGRDLVQTTAANQPQITMNGIVITEKGKPTVSSTGAVVMSSTGNAIPVTTAISSFTLLRTNTIKSNNNSGMFLGLIGGAHLAPSRNSAGTNRYYGTADVTYPALPTGNNFITITNNSNKVDAWENGTQILNTVNSASDSVLQTAGINLFDRWLNSAPLTRGTGISELIVYNSDQRTNRSAIESSMNSYFNVSYTDTDAQTFITNAGITNDVQQSAIIALVKMLKNEGLWTKMRAIYPFVGGSAATHKFNLKDPRDTNDAFRLLFYGGLSHDGNGVQFNGSNSWCDTNLNAATNLTVDNLHVSFYSRTNNNNQYSGGEIGHVGYNSWTSPPQDYTKQFTLRVRNSQYAGSNAQFTSGNLTSTYTNADGFGLTIGSITNSTTSKMFRGKNSSEFATRATATGTNTGTLPSFNISLGKTQGYGEWSNQQAAFVSIGDGLTDSESAKLYGIVQLYQIALGRSV